jgi:hypothetical protein
MSEQPPVPPSGDQPSGDRPPAEQPSPYAAPDQPAPPAPPAPPAEPAQSAPYGAPGQPGAAQPAPPAYGPPPPLYGQPPAYGQPTYGQPHQGQPPAYGQPTQYGQPQFGQPAGYGAPPYGGYAAPPATPGSTIALTVVSGIATFFCFGIPSLILGIIALTKVSTDIEQTKRLTKIGWIVFAVLGGLAVLGFIALIVIGIATDNNDNGGDPTFGTLPALGTTARALALRST